LKLYWQIMLMVFILTFTSCGQKKSGNEASSSNQISSTYILLPFNDINRPSTLNLELLKDLPHEVDLRNKMTPVKDQEGRGTCTFFSAIAVVEAAIKEKMHVDVNLSEEYLSYITKKDGYYPKDEGGAAHQNLEVAIHKKGGFLLERDWPYQPMWFGEKSPCKSFLHEDASAPAECFLLNSPPTSIMAKKIPADNFEVYRYDTQSTNEILSLLALKQRPFTISLPFSDDGVSDDGTVIYTDEIREGCVKKPSSCGLHSVVLTGYDLNKKVFYFKNSWGEEWGQKGYGTVGFDVVDRHTEPRFVTVELKEKINMPKDYEKDFLEYKNFQGVMYKGKDQSVTMKYIGQVNNVGFHALRISTTLVQKNTSPKISPSDESASEVTLNADEAEALSTSLIEAKKNIFQDKEANVVSWTNQQPLILQLSSDFFQTQTFQSLKSDNNTELYLKNTLEVHTDRGYRALKKFYYSLAP
jgi:hypothetical protein